VCSNKKPRRTIHRRQPADLTNGPRKGPRHRNTRALFLLAEGCAAGVSKELLMTILQQRWILLRLARITIWGAASP